MISAEIQIHGYRKGHQLLASSVTLAKDDQAVVDRMSDIAGPLRPKEQFAPYLSAYPLPSGKYYVVARTWQDLTVPRAGCVITKSIFIDAQTWASSPLIIQVLELLNAIELPGAIDAVTTKLNESLNVGGGASFGLNAKELLEALFLEDTKPIVVFDAPNPELTSMRLIAALWPEIRRRFALSTFALSPRKIGGRDMDLVFAPLNAKSKFSDWPGRRVDGRSLQPERHKWTSTIFKRVFEESVPKLLSEQDIQLLGSHAGDSSSALRITLLWNELLEKLLQTPTAVLGLLDIANSGMVSNAAAIKLIEPHLTEAALRARTIPSDDAWDFTGAIARKMQGHDMPASQSAIRLLATHLAEHAPDGAVKLLQQIDPKKALSDLTPSIVLGLEKGATPLVEQALIAAPADVIARILLQNSMLNRRIAANDELIKKLGMAFAGLDQKLARAAGRALLPHLVEDRHLPVAIPIFKGLDEQEFIAALRQLGEANGYEAEKLSSVLVDCASNICDLSVIRDVLINVEPSISRDKLLELIVRPTREDLTWLLTEKRLSQTASNKLIKAVLGRASARDLAILVSAHAIANKVIELLPKNALEKLLKIISSGGLPINTLVRIIGSIFSILDYEQKSSLAEATLEKLLQSRFDGNEAETLRMLFGEIGNKIDAKYLIRTGLARELNFEIASRNLIAFENAPLAVRQQIVKAARDIAYALIGRHNINLTEAACNACAKLMMDADKVLGKEFVNVSGELMPTLLHCRYEPVSSIVAVLFPIVYREFAKADDVPDLLKFVPFVDWDRCKSARNELVDVFISSSWAPVDLAITACRCSEVERILNRVAKSKDGENYIKKIESDLERLDDEQRRSVRYTISQIKHKR
ncbi:GAP1-N1 domain-containing protein [Pseudomonas sp. EA_15y_Pfl1_P101]|uniref:GAP1-N1 domain-containing protein n=1 Tax=Pseudomonas sp. EA_15y_Pfl1_P101 TaxID=3088684 RepID=UPI0030DB1097